MRQDDVREYLEREPFQPFRIYLSTGVFFDIRQAELVEAGRSMLTIGFPVQDERQRFVHVALIHIAWLEILLPVPG